jgi:imidazolonepropionase-like amidohydrolase
VAAPRRKRSLPRRTGRIALWTLAALAVLIAAAILLPPTRAPLPNDARAYLVRNVRIVDVEAGAAGAPTSVLIRDGAIAAIGEADGTGAVAVDGGGGFLVPGFWDMHAHSFQLSPQLHFPQMVANGVTNMRDMMDCPEEQDSLIACAADKTRWSREAQAGEIAAPRFVEVASYYLEQPDLTPGEVAARARAYAARGIDALKVYNRLTPEAYRAAGASARALDLRLVGHLPRRVSLEDALAAGQASFEHAHLLPRHCFRGAADWRAGRLDDLPPATLAGRIVAEHDPAACERAFAALREAGAWLVPTHVTREEDARADDPIFASDPRLVYLDPLSRWAYRDDLAGTAARHPGPEGARALRAYFAHGLQLTGRAHRAGVRVLVGTDTAIGGFRYHDEMAHLVRAGMTPAEVLRAATIEAARYAGLERESGSIAPGKRADLVLLAANPLDDIAHTRRIEAVFLAGRLYDRAGLDALLAFNRSQARNPANWVRLLWGFAWSSVSSDL